MMPLDPVIAGGFRGIQLQDPLEQYARVSQIQQAQQQNQLAALKMQEYQRKVETENRLRALYQRPGADIRSPEFLREVYSVSPAKGAAMQKSAFEAEKEKRLSDAAMEDLAAKRIANARQMLPGVTPETWGAWRADTIQKLPGLANMIPEAYSDDAKMQLMQTADQYLAAKKPMTVAPGASVYQPGKGFVGTAPAEPEKPPADIATMKALGFPLTQEGYTQFAGARKPVTNVTVPVKLPEQEKAFEGELGKGQAKKLMEDKVAADDARSIISTIDEGRRLLKSGVITGFGADFLTGLGAALNQAGISFAEDSVANTQAFTANMAANVGRIIKQFGAGTGLSNADREYAEKMAGGKVTLDRKSIERILDINERMARNVISLHNRNAAKVKTNVPLTVEEPPRAGAQAGGASVTLPDGRVMNFPNAEAAAAFKKAAGL
jgi:hypothetical protein